ncbi:MAG TPA: J domain-containing protein, partial [Coleofasciculaceae cyanobacterium]
MSFQIERGLFKLDFIDHYAILGIPVTTDEKEVRKRYLKIARRLHPDSCKSESESEKKHANELLTKLVNPAYEQLSRSNREYMVSLGHLGKRLAAERGKVSIGSQSAKQLAQSGANLDNAYKSTVQNLAAKQYESLDQVLDKIAEISELNMVYLMMKEGKGIATKRQGLDGGPGDKDKDKDKELKKDDKSHHPVPTTGEQAYIRRAQGYMEKNNFAGAVLELREALKLQPTSSVCHSLLGFAYLKQNQVTMAKVHITKALQLNPKDERALKCKQFI